MTKKYHRVQVMTEEECRRDDEMMREKRLRQRTKNKELSFIEWFNLVYSKEEKANNENCD